MLEETAHDVRPEVAIGEFPYKRTTTATESRYLTWLRNHSNYMAVRGVLDYFRMVAVLVRGILVNFLVLIPYLMVIGFVLSLIYGTLIDDWNHQALAERAETAETKAKKKENLEKREREAAAKRDKAAKLAKTRNGGAPEQNPEPVENIDENNVASKFFLFRPAKETGWAKWMQENLHLTPPFIFTPLVLALAILWVLVFPILMVLFRINGYRRSLETGSDSSVRLRDRFERSFGALLLLIVAVALFETLPLVVYYYHLITEDGVKSAWQETLAATLAALVTLSFSGKWLKLLKGVWKQIAIAVVGALGLLAPLLFIVLVMDFLIFVSIKPKFVHFKSVDYYLWLAFFVPLLLLPFAYAVGIAAAILLGFFKRAFSFREYLRLVALFLVTTVFHFALIVVMVIVWAIVSEISDEYLPEIFAGDDWGPYFVLAWAFEIWFFCWLTVDVNSTSIHALYRDRLASAYLMGRDIKGEVDIEHDIALEEICCHELGSTAPYHLVNVALNLQGSKDISLRDRQSDFFIFSKKFIGGLRTGFCQSATMQQVFPRIDLASAMAISAAAASPNMGRGTSALLVAFMTLLNIRLGVWVPNPGVLEAKITGHRFTFDDVFREELKEIQKRWEQVYPDGGQRRLVPRDTPTAEHGLVGIGFSGGGIRSATVNLGIAQALHHAGIFDHLDYLSTVSGGGYLGSSISTLMRYRTSPSTAIAGAVTVAIDPITEGWIVTVTGKDVVKRKGADGVIHEGPDVRTYRYSRRIHLQVKTGDHVHAGQALIHRPGPRFQSDIAGAVSVETVAAEIIVRVTGSDPALKREYHYSRYAQLNVKDGDTIQAGALLIKRRDSFGDRFLWQVPPRALVNEMTMSLDEKYPWVNVSDGGHIENLAAIELLRRRCKLIIIGDGEADPHHYFNGLATLIRTARLDLGVHFEGNVDGLRLNKKGCCRKHWAIGRITYPGDDVCGYLLYLKSSFTGDEDEVIGEYRHSNPSFPHQSTADQFFDEGQFEAYRALGQHIGEMAIAALKSKRPGAAMSYTELNQCFEELWRDEETKADSRKILLPAPAVTPVPSDAAVVQNA